MAWDLVTDIGGTNARFARVEAGQICDTATFPSADISILEAAAQFVGDQIGTPNRILSAAAGPVFDGRIHLTNIDQLVDVGELKQAAKAERSSVINDFEAAAWAMATVSHDDLDTLRGELKDGHRLVLGPGTGLGVGALLQFNGQYHALPGEGGHVTLAGKTHQDSLVFQEVLKLWPEVQTAIGENAMEAEAILSGRGLPILYQACCVVLGQEFSAPPIEEIMASAKDKSDRASVLMASIFRRYLGQVCGDLAVTIRSSGGIFLVGGVSTKNPWLYNQEFLDAINAGGRFQGMRSDYNVHLYQRDDFGLIGAVNALTLGA